LGAGEARDRRGELLVIGQPRALTLVVAEDRPAAPGVQLREGVLPRAPGHEAQRVPGEIVVDVLRKDELVAETRQRIGGVLRARRNRAQSRRAARVAARARRRRSSSRSPATPRPASRPAKGASTSASAPVPSCPRGARRPRPPAPPPRRRSGTAPADRGSSRP